MGRLWQDLQGLLRRAHGNPKLVSQSYEARRDEIDHTTTNESATLQKQPKASLTETPSTPWTPAMLRKRALVPLIVANITLLSIVTTIHQVSRRNRGLANDNGSAATFFASRFLPTICAVIFGIFLSILLDAVKRTESLARLSRAKGAPASISLLYRPGAWWDALAESFPRRRHHYQRDFSPALFCSSIACILGFLALSPLSSTLLVSESITFESSTALRRLSLESQQPIQLLASDENSFRTLSNVLLGATTSAWLTRTHAVLPFWPASQDTPPLQAILSPEGETLKSETTVFSTEMVCDPLRLTEYVPIQVYSQETNMTFNVTRAVLSSEHGCSMTFVEYLDAGLYWLNSSSDTANPTASKEFSGCGSNETIILVSGGQAAAFSNETNADTNSAFAVPNALTCQTRYYMSETPVDVSTNSSGSFVLVDEAAYNARRLDISATVLDTSEANTLSLDQGWSQYVTWGSGDDGYGSFQGSGPGAILGAMNNFSSSGIEDVDLVAQGNLFKQRLLGEHLYDAFLAARDAATTSSGIISTDRRRIVVVSTAAIVIQVILGLQVLLLLAVFLYSSKRIRPLNITADPATAITVARSLTNQANALATLRFANSQPATDTYRHISCHRYMLSHDQLLYLGPDDCSTPHPRPKSREGAKIKQAKLSAFPFALKVSAISALTVTLAMVLAAVLSLLIISETSGLYQKGFVYEARVQIGTAVGLLNPASLITTLVAVCISLWWGSIDETLRTIQPYLTLTKSPATGRLGSFLSYQSSYFIWAAVRAFRRSHWMLCLVCVGTCFTQIFTIAMGALWSRESIRDTARMTLPQGLQLRQTPLVSEAAAASHGSQTSNALFEVFGDIGSSWMYNSVVRMTLNGSQPKWTAEDWSFMPLNLSSIDSGADARSPTDPSLAVSQSVELTHASFTTQAIRARLECMAFNSTDLEVWLTEHDLTNSSAWNTSVNPSYTDKGFELGYASRLPYSSWIATELNETDPTSPPIAQVPFYGSGQRVICCENITDTKVGPGSVGYWTSDDANGYKSNSFMVKWIHGQPIQGYRMADGPDYEEHLIWTEPPRLAALNCTPVIETAEANVTVETATGRVLQWQTIGQPQPDSSAWTDAFKYNETVAGSGYSSVYNMTTSYGVLFVAALLNAAWGSRYSTSYMEAMHDRTFKFRLPGLNVDYMTYAMLKLAGDDHQALLDPEILYDTANRAFATLFQDFVNHNVSLTHGGWAYESFSGGDATKLRSRAEGVPSSTTGDGQVSLEVSRPIEVLKMSPVAAGISIAVLCCLIAIAILVAISSHRQQDTLFGKLESLADIGVLVAGSEKLLARLRDDRITDDEWKNSPALCTQLGWFTDSDGSRRWGIELVEAFAEDRPGVQKEEQHPEAESLLSGEAPSAPPTAPLRASPPEGGGRPESQFLLPRKPVPDRPVQSP